jgi:hypothetical protein
MNTKYWRSLHYISLAGKRSTKVRESTADVIGQTKGHKKYGKGSCTVLVGKKSQMYAKVPDKIIANYIPYTKRAATVRASKLDYEARVAFSSDQHPGCRHPCTPVLGPPIMLTMAIGLKLTHVKHWMAPASASDPFFPNRIPVSDIACLIKYSKVRYVERDRSPCRQKYSKTQLYPKVRQARFILLFTKHTLFPVGCAYGA